MSLPPIFGLQAFFFLGHVNILSGNDGWGEGGEVVIMSGVVRV